MSRKIPKKIRESLYNLVAEKAASVGYRKLSLPDSSRFMDELMVDELVGGKLKEYLPQDRIRTYIKDTLLDKYNRTKNKLPRTAEASILEAFKTNSSEIDYEGKNLVSLHRLESPSSDEFVVVARGTFSRWESALRRALNYIVCLRANQLRKQTAMQIAILLLIKPNNDVTTGADRETLRKALDTIGVRISFVK